MADAFDWHTSKLNLASALGGLLFPIRPKVSQDTKSGKVLTLFEVGTPSVDKRWHRGALLLKLAKNKLEAEDALHPLLQGLRSLHNYEMLLAAQKSGQHLRLVGVAGSHASEYREGQEIPEMVNAMALYKTGDLSLCAALGTLGIPVVKIDDAGGGRHHYLLPMLGHPLNFRGAVVRHSIEVLAKRAAADTYDLMLERTDPQHPMVAAYNAPAVRAQLKKHLNEVGRIIVHRHPRKPNTTMATTTENPAENVKKALRKHMSS
jgi:hypothetical protein